MEDRALAGDGVRRGPAPVQPDSQHIERRDYGRDDDARPAAPSGTASFTEIALFLECSSLGGRMAALS
jgi:hypothetical protein